MKDSLRLGFSLEQAFILDYMHHSLSLPEGAIEKGESALHALLPRETANRFFDLVLLSLIFPFEVTTEEEKNIILSNVEYFLTRDMGVIRYRNDIYYNNNKDGITVKKQNGLWAYHGLQLFMGKWGMLKRRLSI